MLGQLIMIQRTSKFNYKSFKFNLNSFERVTTPKLGGPILSLSEL